MEQPQTQNITLEFDMETIFTAFYTIVDDLYQKVAPLSVINRPGPDPVMSDSEVVTIALVGELLGMDAEYRWYGFVAKNYPYLFRHLVERSRYNRRRRDLWQVTNLIRRHLAWELVAEDDPFRAIDSLPVVVAKYSRRSRVKVARGEADYGVAVANQMHFFGYRLHLLVTLRGVITNFVLAPARPHDVRVAPEVLQDETNLVVSGDAGYVSESLAEDLRGQGIILLTPGRQGQSRRPPREMRRLLRSVRQIIETVGSQLERIFNVSVVLAKSVWGIKTRIIDKLTSHTLACYLNHMLGRSILDIASLISD